MTNYAEQNNFSIFTVVFIWYHSEKPLGDISCMCIYFLDSVLFIYQKYNPFNQNIEETSFILCKKIIWFEVNFRSIFKVWKNSESKESSFI